MPGAEPESEGIYRYLRHPNWFGVVMEIVSIPMLHGAWLTATIFLVLELLLLRHRARVETDALRAAARGAIHSPLRVGV
jgi:methyltransferase